MAKRQVNIRLPEEPREQIARLSAHLGGATEAAVVTMAVALLYDATFPAAGWIIAYSAPDDTDPGFADREAFGFSFPDQSRAPFASREAAVAEAQRLRAEDEAEYVYVVVPLRRRADAW